MWHEHLLVLHLDCLHMHPYIENETLSLIALLFFHFPSPLPARSPFSIHILRIHSKLHVTLPYSQKYWQELNLAIGPQIVIVKILADLNLAVR